MIKVEMANETIEPMVLCNICEGPITHHSEGVGVYQQQGSLLRFHHTKCVTGGFTEQWPSLSILEIFRRSAAVLQITPSDLWPEGC